MCGSHHYESGLQEEMILHPHLSSFFCSNIINNKHKQERHTHTHTLVHTCLQRGDETT